MAEASESRTEIERHRDAYYASNASTVADANAGRVAAIPEAQRRVLMALCRPAMEGGPRVSPPTNDEIAAELHISHDTVRTHVRNAMNKVGARSRAHLVAKVLAEGHALG